jgi:N-acetylmuramoyl-L-alanine amidase
MPDNTLLKQLVSRYAAARISHPQLKSVTLAQWLLESGRGTSPLAVQHLNFGGLKWRPEMAPHARSVSYEAHDGRDDYCKFASVDDFIAGYWTFIGRSPYRGWESHSSSGAQFMRFVGPIYCPKKGYADEVLALVPEAERLLSAAGGDSADASPAPAPAPAPAARGKHLGTIVLDPGHGGKADLPGSSWNNATSASGVLEKTLTLDFCRVLADELEKQAAAAGHGIDVVMTRKSDVNVAGAARAAHAATHKARRFLSLHFNGYTPETSGTETYYGAKENGNLNLKADMSFAQAVQDGATAGLKSVGHVTKDRKIKPDTLTKHKKLAVLSDINLGNANRADKCAAALLELEFITNTAVDHLLISGPKAAANRQAVLASVAKAIVAEMA